MTLDIIKFKITRHTHIRRIKTGQYIEDAINDYGEIEEKLKHSSKIVLGHDVEKDVSIIDVKSVVRSQLLAYIIECPLVLGSVQPIAVLYQCS